MNDAPAPAPTETTKALPIAPEGSTNVLGAGPPRAAQVQAERSTTTLAPELKAKYAAELKAKREAGISVAPSAADDDEVVPIGAANAAAAAAPVVPAKTPVAAADPALATAGDALAGLLAQKPSPAAPSRADVEAAALARAEIEAREKTISEREARLAEQEARFRDVSERFDVDTVGVVRDLVRASLPASATEEEFKSAFADAVMELSFVAGGITPPDDEREKRAMRKQVKALQLENKRGAKAKAEAEAAARKAQEESAAAAAEADRYKRGVSTVAGLMPADKMTDYPWLAGAANPHEIVWSFVDRHHQRTGEMLTLEAAAKYVNNALEEEMLPLANRYRDLLLRTLQPTPAAVPAAATSTRPRAHQDDHQDRSSATAPATAAPPAEPLTGEDFVEERRRQTLAKARAKLG